MKKQAMKIEVKNWTVRQLIELYHEEIIYADPEYQRGLVWSEENILMLMDSVFRGYRLPLFYLCQEKNNKDNDKPAKKTFAIIDGQQRIHALHAYAQAGMYIANVEVPRGGGEPRISKKPVPALYDPTRPGDGDRFTKAHQRRKVAWAGKKFGDLAEEHKNDFMDKEVSVVVMESDKEEMREMFIRLQGGDALSPQEVRDAWPGDFCQLILKLGGKPQLGFHGHEFFRKLMGCNPGSISDRGQTRQFAAELLRIFLIRQNNQWGDFTSLHPADINKSYRTANITFNSDEAKRFVRILDKLLLLFRGCNTKFKLYDAIHLVLFTDMLLDDFSDEWEGGVVEAHNRFNGKVHPMEKVKELLGHESKDFIKFWNYYQMKGKKPAHAIRLRHATYVQRMLQFLSGGIRARYTEDGVTEGILEAIYYRDERRCHFCDAQFHQEVEWDNAAVYPVSNPDSAFNSCPILSNYVLIHRACPGTAAVADDK